MVWLGKGLRWPLLNFPLWHHLAHVLSWGKSHLAPHHHLGAMEVCIPKPHSCQAEVWLNLGWAYYIG